MVQEAAALLSHQLARMIDALLREAVSRYLGRDDWALTELEGRGLTTTYSFQRERVTSLDGVPILYLLPEETALEDDKMSVSRKYKFLTPDNRKPKD